MQKSKDSVTAWSLVSLKTLETLLAGKKEKGLRSPSQSGRSSC
jgi:hypothetical protein